MAYIVDHVEVRKLLKKKQDNEVNLSHAIYDIFNKEPWITNIRRTVKSALGAMLRGNLTYLVNAVKAESSLQVWTRQHAQQNKLGVEKLYYNCGSDEQFIHRASLNAADCADLFRLFGAWVEEHKNSQMAFIKEQERVGSGVKDGPWQQPKDGKMGIRHREDIFIQEKKMEKRGNAIIDRTPIDVRKQLLLHRQDKHKDQIGIAGRELKRIPKNQSDSVLKIDQLFGLRDICSISGTTADVMYIINVFGNKSVNGYSNLGEVYRVLPFGTIAGFHHHSILEVALPQSLRGYIDYRIGFYNSLMPPKAEETGLTKLVKDTLNKHELFVHQNHLDIICFYENGFPEGAIVLISPDEIERFQKSPLSQAVKLSEKMPVIRNGKLSFIETMDTIHQIDKVFAGWLERELRTNDKAKYERVATTGRVRQ